MARQKGVIKLHGTIDDFTFLRTRDGFIAKQKTSLSASRLATDPAFVRTRENGAEFARAGKGSKLLRAAFRPQMLNARDRSIPSRLTTAMMRVVKSDPVNLRGQRTVAEGELSQLANFEFNSSAQMAETLNPQFATSIDRATGEASVTFPPFIPLNEVAAPLGSSHYRLLAAAAAVDFDSSLYERNAAPSGMLPLDAELTKELKLTCHLAANSLQPIFLVVGIEFYQMVNGAPYPLKSGVFNALTLANISEPE